MGSGISMSNLFAYFNTHGYLGYILASYALAGFFLGAQVYRSIRRSKFLKKSISSRCVKL